MGGNIWKAYIWYWTCVSRIYNKHSKLIKKKANNSIQKMGKRSEDISRKKIHEKMFTSLGTRENANESHNEMSLHTCWQNLTMPSTGKQWNNWDSHSLLTGMQNGIALWKTLSQFYCMT